MRERIREEKRIKEKRREKERRGKEKKRRNKMNDTHTILINTCTNSQETVLFLFLYPFFFLLS